MEIYKCLLLTEFSTLSCFNPSALKPGLSKSTCLQARCWVTRIHIFQKEIYPQGYTVFHNCLNLGKSKYHKLKTRNCFGSKLERGWTVRPWVSPDLKEAVNGIEHICISDRIHAALKKEQKEIKKRGGGKTICLLDNDWLWVKIGGIGEHWIKWGSFKRSLKRTFQMIFENSFVHNYA